MCQEFGTLTFDSLFLGYYPYILRMYLTSLCLYFLKKKFFNFVKIAREHLAKFCYNFGERSAKSEKLFLNFTELS